MECAETKMERVEDSSPPLIGTPCTAVNECEIVRLLSESYGLKVTEIKSFIGYYDRNFHVKVERQHDNPYIGEVNSQDDYFVKVYNINSSRNVDYLDARLSIAGHLIEKGINCQRLVKTRHGADFGSLQLNTKEGKQGDHKTTVQTFLPGITLSGRDLTPTFLHQLGVFVAEITKALEDFYHPFYDCFEHKWALSAVLQVTNFLSYIQEEKRLRLCEDVLQAFEEDVIPRTKTFRKGTIHGDLNNANILVNEGMAEAEPRKICGLLDFEDCTRTCTIYDIAICIAYMMMLEVPNVPLLDIPGHMIVGYTSLVSLNEGERESLRVCIAARMVQSLVIGQYTHSLDPANTYVLESNKLGWKALAELWESPKEDFEIRWNKIIQSYNMTSR